MVLLCRSLGVRPDLSIRQSRQEPDGTLLLIGGQAEPDVLGGDAWLGTRWMATHGDPSQKAESWNAQGILACRGPPPLPSGRRSGEATFLAEALQELDDLAQAV
jgi:hypothetical protein